MTTALKRAGSARPGALLVSGDAGVGKSRLLSELLRLARDSGDAVFLGRCVDTGESALPYLPFAEIIAQLHEHDPELLADSPALLRLVPGRGDDGAEGDRDLGQLRLFDALRSVVDKLAADTTVVLAFEDLHWADRSSRELLSFLLSRLTHQRLLVVATLRSDDLHRRHPLRPLLAELVRLEHVERLHLEPFASADIDAFVRAVAGVDLTEPVVSAIAERSEGNAFLAEELVSAATADIPPELAEVLLARVERLSAPTRRAMRQASVAGREFSHDRFCAVTDLTADERDTALREAVTHNVLVIDETTGAYSFRHALLHEAVYQDLLPGERSRLHARVAEALRAEPAAPAAEIARHSMESHDLPAALTASIAAAEQAEAVGAPAEVLIHTERVLRLWSAVPDVETLTGETEVMIMSWAAWAAGASGDPDRATALSRAAVELVDPAADVWLAAELRRRYAEALLSQDGNEHRAEAAATEAWELIAEFEPNARKARLQATMARVVRSTRRVREAAELASGAIATAKAAAELLRQRRAEGIADPEPNQDTKLLAAEIDARITRVQIVDRVELSPDAVTDTLDEIAKLAAEAELPGLELRARYMGSLAQLEAGHLDRALAGLDVGVERAVALGVTWGGFGLELRVVQALARYMSGDWDGAQSATELVGESVSGNVITRVSAAGLLVSVGRGQFAMADRRLAHLRDRWHLDIQVLSFVGVSGTELERYRGQPARGAAHAEKAVKLLQDQYPGHMATVSLAAVGTAAYADLAEAARQAKDAEAEAAAVASGTALADRAHVVFDNAKTATGSVGPEGVAWLRQVEAETSRLRGEADPAPWRQVLAAFDYGEVYRQAVARLRLAQALLAGGGRDERVEAAEHLAQAAETAQRLGAAPLVEAVAALSRRARLRAEAAPGPGLLTDREFAVLRLVAAGRTNKQVGAELFISDKTVSVHLSRVMAKLGVTSRTEAVSAAYTAGLLDG